MAEPLAPPLEGVRVLELAHLIAGPICGMYLGDMGADVVKVESRDAPDAGRSVYRVFLGGEGILHLTVNRNKRGVCLDLKRPEGRQAFLRLARWADVMIEGFRGGVAERLGIGYESLRAVNPRLIYCSVSAFGPEGPWRDKPGLDSLAQAVGGLMAITGEPDGSPVLCGAPVADTLGGLLAMVGILTALLGRAVSRQGQRVDASLLNGILLAHAARLSVFHETGEPLKRWGSGHPEIVPYQAVRAKDDWIFIAAWIDRLWEPLCGAIGRPELARDPRFVTNADRIAHRKELGAILDSAFATRTVAEWMETLERADVLCAPINDYPALVRDPQVRATGMIVEQEHPRAGRFTTIGTPVRFDTTPGRLRRPAPALGEHTREVLAEAGFTGPEIDALAVEGVI
ncbi:MAG TPA: CoA transferase [Methylomirabilota bacterium]|nr:CoA transferase [Methylomirabilota bacterium]